MFHTSRTRSATWLANKSLLLILSLSFVSGCSSSPSKTETIATAPAAEDLDNSPGAKLYAQHCASCHGQQRLGGNGPALLPVSLKRVRQKKATSIIKNGSPATQMPAFGKSLTEEQISSVVSYIFKPPKVTPSWSEADIKKSWKMESGWENWQNKPTFKADPLNIFMVVEAGDHHITVLDGDRQKALHRFATRHSLHGGIKYSKSGRYAYFTSRDGWVTSYDLFNLKKVAEVRAGINTRNIAVSADGRYVAAGNYLPHSVVIFKAPSLEPIKILKAESISHESSRVSAVYTAAPRESFFVALKDVPELWEVSYRDDARAPYTGLVHDFRSESGEEIPQPKVPFPIRRIQLEGPLDDFFFDQDYKNLVGASRNGGAWVVNLIVGRPIKKIALSGMPHLGAGISWTYRGRRVMASPNLRENKITILDTDNWEVIKDIPTKGPGFFLRSHENSRYAWADVFFGPNKDLIHIIDKKKLQIVKTLKPAPGKTSGHVEFDRRGNLVLLSIWEDPGELLVMDARSLKIRKRLPMRKPSGKYNVYNKTRLSEGTSH